MTNAAQKVFADALSLSEDERRELAEVLLDSLSVEERAEIEEAWREEILRRMEEVRSGRAPLESWDEVRRAGREAIGR
jgi:putative addiction module component (TIGR02574 family)